jgi:alpha-beta hydrolase superfamily lysophospholipase
MTDAEFLAMENSTIVRSSKLSRTQPIVRGVNRLLSALAPSAAAWLAERQFLTPPRPRRPDTELALLAGARARPLFVGTRHVELWLWGTGPSVLLVHGWGGRGTQLGSFVEPLVARGFSVVTFDAPGHGASGAGLVTIPQIVAATRAAAATRGALAGLIAHSVGATVAARAMYEGLDAAAAVFVAPAADLAGPATRFTAMRGFTRHVGEAMQQRIEARAGSPVLGVRRDGAGARAEPAAAHRPRSRRRRGAVAARPADRPRVAGGGAADDRRARSSSHPARSRRDRRYRRLPGRPHRGATADTAHAGHRGERRSAGNAARGDVRGRLRSGDVARDCAGCRPARA